MDLLASVTNYNVLILLSIVGIIEYLKKLDPKEKLKKLYVLYALIVSAGASYLLTQEAFNYDHTFWKDFGLNWFIYFGTSTLFYQYVLRYVYFLAEKLDPKNRPGFDHHRPREGSPQEEFGSGK
jgi:hypothetical protein